MLKVNSEKELIDFLKILAEESVKKSQRILKEEDDPYSSYYQNKREEEKMIYEEEEDEQPPSSVPDEAEPEEDQTPQETQADDTSEEDESAEAFIGSKDRLVDFVNDIRSAPSIKDTIVSDQIDAYYDKLSQEERDVLVFFLRELSRVMTGKASGAEARDPSDPPLNIDFVSKDQEEEQAPADQPSEEKPTPGAPPAAAPPSAPASSEEEDTSAPIRVNETQDHSYIREKIRRLLK